MKTTPTRRGQIVLVAPGLLPESVGGAERQASVLPPELTRIGWDVQVLAPTTDPHAPTEETRSGVRTTRLRLSHYPNLGGWHMVSFLCWTVRAFFWLVRQRKNIDGIYVFHARLHVTPAALAAAVLRKPLFIKLGRGGRTFDFYSLNKKKYFYGALVLALVKRITSLFIANSQEIVDDLTACGIAPWRITLLPNGVVLPSEETIAKARDVRTGRVFLYAGRLAPEKNVDRLIDAFTRAKLPPDTTLCIAGDGPLMGALRARAEASGAAAQISFLGHVTDMQSLYAGADFFVSVSDAEGQSNSLLEAMSYANVPIVFGASGSTDLVSHDETGLLLPTLDVAEISAMLQNARALDLTRREKLSRAARARIVATHSVEAVARLTGECFARTIAKSRSA